MAYILSLNERSMVLVDGTDKTDVYVSSVLIEAETDLQDLPATLSPGSMAYTAGFGKIWQKDFDGSWVEVDL